jgi:hypothetical protein
MELSVTMILSTGLLLCKNTMNWSIIDSFMDIYRSNYDTYIMATIRYISFLYKTLDIKTESKKDSKRPR